MVKPYPMHFWCQTVGTLCQTPSKTDKPTFAPISCSDWSGSLCLWNWESFFFCTQPFLSVCTCTNRGNSVKSSQETLSEKCAPLIPVFKQLLRLAHLSDCRLLTLRCLSQSCSDHPQCLLLFSLFVKLLSYTEPIQSSGYTTQFSCPESQSQLGTFWLHPFFIYYFRIGHC